MCPGRPLSEKPEPIKQDEPSDEDEVSLRAQYFQKPIPLPKECWRRGKVQATAMSRILGIDLAWFRQLVARGWIPFKIDNKQRWFNVDEIIAWAIETMVICPPLNKPSVDHTEADDFRWAWNALGLGPWRCVIAPSGRAWKIYLDAKKYMIMRSRLTAMFAAEAVKQMAVDRNAPLGSVPDSSGSEPATEVDKKSVEGDLPPSPAEQALQSLDDGIVSGPFAIDGEGY